MDKQPMNQLNLMMLPTMLRPLKFYRFSVEIDPMLVEEWQGMTNLYSNQLHIQKVKLYQKNEKKGGFKLENKERNRFVPSDPARYCRVFEWDFFIFIRYFVKELWGKNSTELNLTK